MNQELRFWRYVFSILALGILILFLFKVWSVVMLFVFGFAAAYLINPLVDRFAAKGFRRDRVVLVLYSLILMASIIFFSWFLPRLYQEVHDFIEDFPSYAAMLDGIVDTLNENVREILTKIIGKKANQLIIPFQTAKMVEKLVYLLPANILNIAHMGLWMFVLPFVCYFSLSHSKRWLDMLFDVTPSIYVENLLGLLAEVSATLGGYIRGLLFESLCVGSLILVGLLMIGVKGAVLLAILAGFLNVVPFMALLLGGSLAMLVGFLQSNSLTTLFGILILYGGVKLIDDLVLIPLVMGHNVKLHPVITLFAILAGVELGGIVGLVFAIPLAAVIKVVCSMLVRNRKEGLLLEKEHIYS